MSCVITYTVACVCEQFLCLLKCRFYWVSVQELSTAYEGVCFFVIIMVPRKKQYAGQKWGIQLTLCCTINLVKCKVCRSWELHCFLKPVLRHHGKFPSRIHISMTERVGWDTSRDTFYSHGVLDAFWELKFVEINYYHSHFNPLYAKNWIGRFHERKNFIPLERSNLSNGE